MVDWSPEARPDPELDAAVETFESRLPHIASDIPMVPRTYRELIDGLDHESLLDFGHHII